MIFFIKNQNKSLYLQNRGINVQFQLLVLLQLLNVLLL